MSENELNDVIDELSEVDAYKVKARRVLANLLDTEGNQEKKYLAVRGMMGQTLGDSGRPVHIPSYSAMLDLGWIANKHILMGSEMDFMKTNIDPKTGKLIIDENSAEEMRQRAPDWTRQADLASYLIQEKYHKFGTILAVISPTWVDDPNHENWGKDNRAILNAAKFEALDSKGDIGLLDLSDVQVYALDYLCFPYLETL